jgi:hypothetical protein
MTIDRRRVCASALAMGVGVANDGFDVALVALEELEFETS